MGGHGTRKTGVFHHYETQSETLDIVRILWCSCRAHGNGPSVYVCTSGMV